MASHGSFSIKPIVSSTRILFGLLPGLGAMILLRMIIHLYRPDIEDAEHRVRDHEFDELYECYDFIIIGAGSAGSVVANRLSENPEWNILLLEAGQDENVLSEVPILFPALQMSAIDWQFVTESSKDYCLSMVDNRCKWPRGKVLGGSSSINAMLYIRGNKKDYDNWASLGNVGWSYNEILKYFLKAEDMRIPEYREDPYHSTGGPLSVEYFRYEQPITTKILEAGQQLGYRVLDVNGEIQTGFTKSHATVRDGLRCSTAKAYLRPAAKRPNLHISVHSLVEKILIDEYRNAIGIKFTKHGKTKIIKSSREVILSAGAIQSPQILMLSGIGDSEDLKELGIYPVNHLPGVGKNLQDHVAMGGHSFLFDNPYSNGSDYCFNFNSVISISSAIDFALQKKGLLYSMMEAEAMAFVNTKYQDPSEDYPDIQFFIAPTADNMDGGLFGKRANGLSDETYAELYEDILYESSFSIVPLLLRPKSRGYIKLRDANPHSPPLIYPNYYTDREDLLRMIEGAKIALRLVEQPALQVLNARVNPNRNPGCIDHKLMSDEHLECQARHHSLTIYHPVGTCAMGPVNDLNAVVDPRLRVYGIKNLRVIDGSIMPKIVNGNTNAPIIMIAEKASDMIKEDWDTATNVLEKCYTDIDAGNEKDTKMRNADDVVSKTDILTEVTNLFPLLSKDVLKQGDLTRNNTEKNITTKTSKPSTKDTETYKISASSFPIRNSYFRNNTPVAISHPKTSLNYLLKPYDNIHRSRLFSPYVNYKSKDNKKQYKSQDYKPSKVTYNQFSNLSENVYLNLNEVNKQIQTNINSKHPRYNFNDKKQETIFYPNGRSNPLNHEKCRLWLYYNGVRYEVEI